MSDTTATTLILGAIFTVVACVAIYVLRGKIKNAEVRAGKISAKVGTHEPDRATVKDVEQNSEQGSNTLNIRTTNVKIDGLKQSSQKDNTLEIGNP